jgi:hypothetical protein
VAGPRHLELGLEFGPDDRVERVIVDVQLLGLLNPLPQRFVGRKAGGLPARLFHGGQYSRGEREGLASRHVQGQQGVQATRFVDGEPVATGMVMNTQELGHVPAGLSLPAGQPIEHLEPWFLATIMCMLEALSQGGPIFGNEG